MIVFAFSLLKECPVLPTTTRPIFYIFTLAIPPGKEIEARQKVKNICDAYEVSEYSRNIAKIVDHEHRNDGNHRDSRRDSDSKRRRSPYKANWFRQFFTVLWRSWLTVVRDPRFHDCKLRAIFCCIVLFS